MTQYRMNGRPCSECDQWVTSDELKDGGKRCVYCYVQCPDAIEGIEMFETQTRMRFLVVYPNYKKRWEKP